MEMRESIEEVQFYDSKFEDNIEDDYKNHRYKKILNFESKKSIEKRIKKSIYNNFFFAKMRTC